MFGHHVRKLSYRHRVRTLFILDIIATIIAVVVTTQYVRHTTSTTQYVVVVLCTSSEKKYATTSGNGHSGSCVGYELWIEIIQSRKESLMAMHGMHAIFVTVADRRPCHFSDPGKCALLLWYSVNTFCQTHCDCQSQCEEGILVPTGHMACVAIAILYFRNNQQFNYKQ